MTLAGEKATKRTRLGKITASITRATVKAANSCSRAQYHVIDSECALGVLLARAASSLALLGDSESVEYGLRGIRPLGVDIMVGLPNKEREGQVTAFGECIHAAMQ